MDDFIERFLSVFHPADFVFSPVLDLQNSSVVSLDYSKLEALGLDHRENSL